MKFRRRLLLLFALFILSSCTIGVEPKQHLGEIYRVALDAIMEQDSELNNKIEFIAIDMSSFDRLTEADKKEILNFFEDKYKVKAMDATFEQLKEMGFYNEETLALDGILLQIKRVEFKWNKHVFFEGAKYRSGLGASGVEVIVHYKEKQWKTKEVKRTWIS